MHRRANGRRLSPRPFVGFGWRRGLRLRVWLWGRRGGLLSSRRRSLRGLSFACRLEPRQGRAQRIEARGVRIFVVFDDAADCRCYRGQLVGGEVNLSARPATSHL
jgi:hypothetical protein